MRLEIAFADDPNVQTACRKFAPPFSEISGWITAVPVYVPLTPTATDVMDARPDIAAHPVPGQVVVVRVPETSVGVVQLVETLFVMPVSVPLMGTDVARSCVSVSGPV